MRCFALSTNKCTTSLGKSNELICLVTKTSSNEISIDTIQPDKKSYAKPLFIIDYTLDSIMMECGGEEQYGGYHNELKFCAEACRGISTMFVYGTNDYGYSGDRCPAMYGGCKCLCETAATSDGDCNRSPHAGYRLYRFTGNYPFQMLITSFQQI